MSLPVNYGSFLRKKESEAAYYQHNRPVISLVFAAIMFFALGAVAVNGLALFHASMTMPKQNYDVNYFNRARQLSDRLSKALAQTREARPDGINAVMVVQNFVKAKPDGVDIENFKISEKKYSVTASTVNMDLANEFLAGLEFDKTRQAVIGNIVTRDDVITFTIDVTAAKAEQKKGGGK